MFKFFNKKEKVPEAPKCNCGAWPDSSWTQEMFLRKYELARMCPVHKGLQMVMMVTKTQVPPASLPPVPESMVTMSEGLGQELKNARIHLLNCADYLLHDAELFKELDGMIETLERIIGEQKS